MRLGVMGRFRYLLGTGAATALLTHGAAAHAGAMDFNLVAAPGAGFAAAEGVSYQLQLRAVTPSGASYTHKPVNFSCQSCPEGMTVNATSGLVTWQPSYEAGGSYLLRFQAHAVTGKSTHKNQTATFQTTIVVNNTNRAPSAGTLTCSPGLVELASSDSLAVEASCAVTGWSDPDSDAPELSMREVEGGSCAGEFSVSELVPNADGSFSAAISGSIAETQDALCQVAVSLGDGSAEAHFATVSVQPFVGPPPPPVVELYADPSGYFWPSDQTRVGNKIVSYNYGETTGSELQIYDPSRPFVAGTNPLTVELYPGPESGFLSFNGSRTADGEKIYFLGRDPDHGAELWLLDLALPVAIGENPRLVADMNPGPGDGNAYGFKMAGRRMFFRANFGPEIGTELGVLDLDAPLSATNPRALDMGPGSHNPEPEHLIGDTLVVKAYRILPGSQPDSTMSAAGIVVVNTAAPFGPDVGTKGNPHWAFEPALAWDGVSNFYWTVRDVGWSKTVLHDGKLYYSARDGVWHGTYLTSRYFEEPYVLDIQGDVTNGEYSFDLLIDLADYEYGFNGQPSTIGSRPDFWNAFSFGSKLYFRATQYYGPLNNVQYRVATYEYDSRLPVERHVNPREISNYPFNPLPNPQTSSLTLSEPFPLLGGKRLMQAFSWDSPTGYVHGEIYLLDENAPFEAGVNPLQITKAASGFDSAWIHGAKAWRGKILFTAYVDMQGQKTFAYDPSLPLSETNPGIVLDARSELTGEVDDSYFGIADFVEGADGALYGTIWDTPRGSIYVRIDELPAPRSSGWDFTAPLPPTGLALSADVGSGRLTASFTYPADTADYSQVLLVAVYNNLPDYQVNCSQGESTPVEGEHQAGASREVDLYGSAPEFVWGFYTRYAHVRACVWDAGGNLGGSETAHAMAW